MTQLNCGGFHTFLPSHRLATSSHFPTITGHREDDTLRQSVYKMMTTYPSHFNILAFQRVNLKMIQLRLDFWGTEKIPGVQTPTVFASLLCAMTIFRKRITRPILSRLCALDLWSMVWCYPDATDASNMWSSIKPSVNVKTTRNTAIKWNITKQAIKLTVSPNFLSAKQSWASSQSSPPRSFHKSKMQNYIKVGHKPRDATFFVA